MKRKRPTCHRLVVDVGFGLTCEDLGSLNFPKLYEDPKAKGIATVMAVSPTQKFNGTGSDITIPESQWSETSFSLKITLSHQVVQKVLTFICLGHFLFFAAVMFDWDSVPDDIANYVAVEQLSDDEPEPLLDSKDSSTSIARFELQSANLCRYPVKCHHFEKALYVINNVYVDV